MRVNFDKAVSLIKKEITPMYAFQHIIIKKKWHSEKKINPNAKANGNWIFNVLNPKKYDPNKIIPGKIISIPEICPDPKHATDNDGSTNFYNKTKDGTFRLRCFSGCCDLSNGLDVFGVWMVYKLGVNPRVVGTPIAKKKWRISVFELAELIGLEVIDGKPIKKTKEQIIIDTKRRVIKRFVEMCRAEYKRNPKFQEYFRVTRGFQYSVIPIEELEEKLQIGCVPNPFPTSWYYDQLKKEFTTEELKLAGIVKQYDLNKPARDFYSEGLIYPYPDADFYKEVYCRALNPKDKKYRHLRLSGKSEKPINWDFAHNFKVVILTEGELSGASLVALDYPNTMATKGTNGISEEDVQLFVKAREDSNGEYCQTIYLCFDDDKAGIGATIKVGKMLLDNNFEVRVIRLNNEDPNDILTREKQNAKTYFDNLYDNAITYHAFVALQTLKFKKRTVANKKRALIETKEILNKVQTLPEDELYLIATEFAEQLQIPLEILWDTWRKKKNENIQALDEANYVFITKDTEGYFLTKYKYPNTAFIEDCTFSFLKRLPRVQWLIADNNYNQEEKEQLKYFVEKNGLKGIMFLDQFRDIIKTDVEEMLKKLFNSRLNLK